MKYFIPVFLLFFALSARAQITLEHKYTNSGQFALIKVDSAEWKYVQFNGKDSTWLFNLDHSLDRQIVAPDTFQSILLVLAQSLFTSDSAYAYMLDVNAYSVTPGLRVFKEDGTLLFSCDTCAIQYRLDGYGVLYNPISIETTPMGTKMIVSHNNEVEVYSLPGQLPRCQSTLAGVTASEAYVDPSLPTSAYPNPSSSRVRIAYQLPLGVSSGEVILTREDGTEVKRYRVTSAFSDLLIDGADLPSGAYFYKLVTEKGESTAQAISILK